MTHMNRSGEGNSVLRRAALCLLASALLTGCGNSSSMNPDSAAESSSVSSAETTEAEITSQDSSLVTDASSSADSGRDDSRSESSRAGESSAEEHTTEKTDASSAPDTERTVPNESSAFTTTPKTGTTAKTASSTKTTSSTSNTTQSTGPKQNLSGFGAKWPDLFTSGGDPVVKSDTFPYSYQSEDINIQLRQQKYGNSVYYIADIHVRYTENLKSAFSINRATGEEEYGENGGANYQEDGAKLSARVNSILTINGDYYSGRKTGIIFRNGQLYRNIPRAEIGAIYKDGTYKGFAKADFDVLAEQEKGLWQVMGFEPRLVENGKALKDIKTVLSGMDVAAPRSGFGYYEPGHYCFVVADGRQADWSVGPELQEWADFFESLGCEGAFNLDGGASSQMYFMGKLINKPTTSTSGGVIRQLPDVFYIGELN